MFRKLRLAHGKPSANPAYVDFVNQFGASSNAYILTAGWARDTRDDILYPSTGRLQSALLESGLPIGDLTYYKLQYTQSSYWPLPASLVLMARVDLGWGDLYFYGRYYGQYYRQPQGPSDRA